MFEWWYLYRNFQVRCPKLHHVLNTGYTHAQQVWRAQKFKKAGLLSCTCILHAVHVQASELWSELAMAQSRPQTLPDAVSTNQPAYSVSIVGRKVTVNTEGTSVQQANHVAVQQPPGPIKSAGARRPVTITPISVNTLPCSVSTVPTTSTVIDKVLLKAVSRAGKNIFKMFTLRNIDCSKVRSRDDLSDKIRHQLLGDIIQDEFDVGFVSGNSIISISNPADLAELWLDVNKGRKVVLWCDGLKSKSSSNTVTSRRRPARESDEDEMDEDTDVARRGQKKRKKNSAQRKKCSVQFRNLMKNMVLRTPPCRSAYGASQLLAKFIPV